MAFIPTTHGVEVVVKGHQGTVPVVNVYHVDAGAAVTETVLEGVEAVFSDWMTGTLLPSLSSTFTLDTITAKDISVANGSEFTETFTTGNVGGASGAPVAANAALVVSQRTNKTGRSFRGRTYVGALPASQQQDEHNMETTYAAGILDEFGDLIDALQSAGYVLCVLSKVANGVQRLTGVLTEIIALIVDTKIDSQRRRTAN